MTQIAHLLELSEDVSWKVGISIFSTIQQIAGNLQVQQQWQFFFGKYCSPYAHLHSSNIYLQEFGPCAPNYIISSNQTTTERQIANEISAEKRYEIIGNLCGRFRAGLGYEYMQMKWRYISTHFKSIQFQHLSCLVVLLKYILNRPVLSIWILFPSSAAAIVAAFVSEPDVTIGGHSEVGAHVGMASFIKQYNWGNMWKRNPRTSCWRNKFSVVFVVGCTHKTIFVLRGIQYLPSTVAVVEVERWLCYIGSRT